MILMMQSLGELRWRPFNDQAMEPRRNAEELKEKGYNLRRKGIAARRLPLYQLLDPMRIFVAPCWQNQQNCVFSLLPSWSNGIPLAEYRSNRTSNRNDRIKSDLFQTVSGSFSDSFMIVLTAFLDRLNFWIVFRPFFVCRQCRCLCSWLLLLLSFRGEPPPEPAETTSRQHQSKLFLFFL